VLVNQFASSIRHKPFCSELDKARVLAFIRALRLIISEGKVEVHHNEPVIDLDVNRNVAGIKSARKTIRKEQP
jgi:hypothetical protein